MLESSGRSDGVAPPSGSSARSPRRDDDRPTGWASAANASSASRSELKRLRRENQTLRMEREILKKAAAFFAKENDER
jgi:transposase